MTRAPKSKEASEALRKLKQVPIDKIKNFNAVVIDQPIGDLSLKNAQRIIYVLNSSLVQMEKHQKALVDEFQRRESETKKLIEDLEKSDEVFNQEFITDRLKQILVVPESNPENSETEKNT